MGNGTGQMMLIGCALVLLAKLVMSANTSTNDADVVLNESEAITAATGAAQAMMERILAKGYDNTFYGGKDTVATAFAATLGRDAGEVAGRDTTFDDIDDYKGYQDSVSSPRLGKFYVSCNVWYANETAPFDTTATRTFLKKVTVSVTSSFLVDSGDPRKVKNAISLTRYVSYR